MRNITEEQIDNAINRAFDEQTENVLSDFINNYDMYKKAFEEIVNNICTNRV